MKSAKCDELATILLIRTKKFVDIFDHYFCGKLRINSIGITILLMICFLNWNTSTRKNWYYKIKKMQIVF